MLGSINTTYYELFKRFGLPVDGKWTATLDYGIVVTIFDPVEQETPMGFYDWRVSGESKYSVYLVEKALFFNR